MHGGCTECATPIKRANPRSEGPKISVRRVVRKWAMDAAEGPFCILKPALYSYQYSIQEKLCVREDPESPLWLEEDMQGVGRLGR